MSPGLSPISKNFLMNGAFLSRNQAPETSSLPQSVAIHVSLASTLKTLLPPLHHRPKLPRRASAMHFSIPGATARSKNGLIRTASKFPKAPRGMSCLLSRVSIAMPSRVTTLHLQVQAPSTRQLQRLATNTPKPQMTHNSRAMMLSTRPWAHGAIAASRLSWMPEVSPSHKEVRRTNLSSRSASTSTKHPLASMHGHSIPGPLITSSECQNHECRSMTDSEQEIPVHTK